MKLINFFRSVEAVNKDYHEDVNNTWYVFINYLGTKSETTTVLGIKFMVEEDFHTIACVEAQLVAMDNNW
jgi:hypothetical protein